MKNIGVFCGASSDLPDHYHQLAARCGEAIAAHGYGLVYGGATSGLMGTLARTATARGTRVIGVFPRDGVGLLREKEVLNQALDETILVSGGMGERKDVMLERSDAFLIIPGGVGTLDELLEVLTLKNLAVHRKPIIIINYRNFWRHLIDLLDHLHKNSFVKPSNHHNYKVVKTVESAFDLLRLELACSNSSEEKLDYTSGATCVY